MSNRRLYALLVAIDKYQAPVPALDGCVNDMRAMRDYLLRYTQRNGVDFHPLVLTNEEVTRFNLVEKFEAHLGQAGENDVALFYYSGHGSQEHAHEIFWEIESDQMNETLVCYDSRLPDGMDLADKEIATLLDVVAENNPHTVVIIDACNSGSGTRSIDKHTKVRQVHEVPRLADGESPRVRMPQSYILPRRTFSERALGLNTDPEELIIPNPRHVALSAARSFQLAKETYLGGQPRGVFTYSLIEVLETTVGALSYNDLMRRVRSLVSQRTYDQMPEINAPVGEDINLEFLNGLTTLSGNYYSVQHESGHGWTLDAGAVHGILPPNFSGKATLLSIYPFEASEAEMADSQQALGRAVVTSVMSGSSIIDPSDGLILDKNKAYKARILEIPVKAIDIYVASNSKMVERIEEAISAKSQFNNYLNIVEQGGRADYRLNHEGSSFSISRSTDSSQIILAAPIEQDDENGISMALMQLSQIARWERIKNLANPGSMLSSEAVKIELVDPDSGQILREGLDGYLFEHNTTADQAVSFKIRVKNVSAKRLFCMLVYFDASFSIASNLLGVNGLWMDPGAVAWAAGGASASAQLPDKLYQLGRTEVDEYLKVVFSTRESNPSLLSMPSIDKMITPRSTPESTRGLVFGSRDASSFDDWNSNELSFRIVSKG